MGGAKRFKKTHITPFVAKHMPLKRGVAPAKFPSLAGRSHVGVVSMLNMVPEQLKF